MKRWLILWVLLLTACGSQTGGGEVTFCTCGTPWIITATPVASYTPTVTVPPPSPTLIVPSATVTATLRPSPSPLPLQPTWNGTEFNPECGIAPGAAPIKPLMDYVYRDYQKSGLPQNVREGPRAGATGYRIKYTIGKDSRHTAYWTYNGWVSLNQLCTEWVFNALGDLLPQQTN